MKKKIGKKIAFLVVGAFLGLYITSISGAELPLEIAPSEPSEPIEQGVYHKVQGDLYLKEGEAALAQAEYKKALSLDYETVTTYFNLAIASYAVFDLESAIWSLKKVIEIDPGDTEALYNLASLNLYQKDVESSKHYLELAKNTVNQNPSFLPLINRALEFVDEFEGADATTQENILHFLSNGLPPTSLGHVAT